MSPRDLKVGVLLPLWNGSLNGETAGIARNRAFARHAEAAGLDSVWFTDHLYWEAYVDFRAVGLQLPEELKGVKGGQWECWTAAAAVAATTSRIHLGTLVCNTTFRNPALLARMVDNVTELSEGRLILGLGAGDFISEHQAYGFDFTRHVGRFEESLQILKPMLRGETVSLQGEFHRVEDAALLPKSAFRAPPLMIGTLKGKPRMSRLVAQHADMVTVPSRPIATPGPPFLPRVKNGTGTRSPCPKGPRLPSISRRDPLVPCPVRSPSEAHCPKLRLASRNMPMQVPSMCP